eukprot:1488029-Pleurochrysis_carterae.AAC.8
MDPCKWVRPAVVSYEVVVEVEDAMQWSARGPEERASESEPIREGQRRQTPFGSRDVHHEKA